MSSVTIASVCAMGVGTTPLKAATEQNDAMALCNKYSRL